MVGYTWLVGDRALPLLTTWLVGESTLPLLSYMVVGERALPLLTTWLVGERALPLLVIHGWWVRGQQLTKMQTGLENRMGSGMENVEWKMEQKMEKLYQTHINLIFFFFSYTFCQFHFCWKVQQCLVTGSK